MRQRAEHCMMGQLQNRDSDLVLTQMTNTHSIGVHLVTNTKLAGINTRPAFLLTDAPMMTLKRTGAVCLFLEGKNISNALCDLTFRTVSEGILAPEQQIPPAAQPSSCPQTIVKKRKQWAPGSCWGSC